MINKFQAVSLILKTAIKAKSASGNDQWIIRIPCSDFFVTITKHSTEKKYLIKSRDGSVETMVESYMKGVGVAASLFVEKAKEIIKTRAVDIATENTGRPFSFSGKVWRIAGYSLSSDLANVVPSDNPSGPGFQVSSAVFVKNIILGNVEFL